MVIKGYAHSVGKHRELLAVADINTSQDNQEVHPITFCNRCYLTLRKLEEADASGNIRETALSPFKWVPHGDAECPVCEHFQVSQQGGRPVVDQRMTGSGYYGNTF